MIEVVVNVLAWVALACWVMLVGAFIFWVIDHMIEKRREKRRHRVVRETYEQTHGHPYPADRDAQLSKIRNMSRRNRR